RITDATFDSQSAGRQFKSLLEPFRAKLNGLGGIRKSKSDMDDIGTGRQDECRCWPLLFLDKSRHPVLLGPIDFPLQSAVDGSQTAAKTRADRQGRLAGRNHRHRVDLWGGALRRK